MFPKILEKGNTEMVRSFSRYMNPKSFGKQLTPYQFAQEQKLDKMIKVMDEEIARRELNEHVINPLKLHHVTHPVKSEEKPVEQLLKDPKVSKFIDNIIEDPFSGSWIFTLILAWEQYTTLTASFILLNQRLEGLDPLKRNELGRALLLEENFGNLLAVPLTNSDRETDKYSRMLDQMVLFAEKTDVSLSSLLQKQDKDGNNTMHLLAIHATPKQFEIAVSKLKAGITAEMLDAKNEDGKSVYDILNDDAYLCAQLFKLKSRFDGCALASTESYSDFVGRAQKFRVYDHEDLKKFIVAEDWKDVFGLKPADSVKCYVPCAPKDLFRPSKIRRGMRELVTDVALPGRGEVVGFIESDVFEDVIEPLLPEGRQSFALASREGAKKKAEVLYKLNLLESKVRVSSGVALGGSGIGGAEL